MGCNKGISMAWPWVRHGSPELANLVLAGRRVNHEVYDYATAVHTCGNKSDVLTVRKIKNSEGKTVGFSVTHLDGQEHLLYMVFVGDMYLPTTEGGKYHIYFKWMACVINFDLYALCYGNPRGTN